MRPDLITPGVLYLVSDDAPTRYILGAGAGAFARTIIYETDGLYIDDPTPEKVAAHIAEIGDPAKQEALQNAFQQTNKFVGKAAAAKGVALNKG